MSESAKNTGLLCLTASPLPHHCLTMVRHDNSLINKGVVSGASPPHHFVFSYYNYKKNNIYI